MKTHLSAIALAATLAQPALAVTFPSLTTIYVATGVKDTGQPSNVGTATVFQCSNVSGLIADIRILIIDSDGVVAGQVTRTVAHGETLGLSTHLTDYWGEDQAISAGTPIFRGTANIESTQSGVFCQGYLVEAAPSVPTGVPLHLIRVNPHPGTVE
jgi:hypothetical protein